MRSPLPWLRVEGLAVLVLSTFLYSQHGAGWLLFALLLLAPDLSLAGYLAGPAAGARVYNLFHSYTAPLLLALAAVASGHTLPLAIALVWVAHVGLDRMLGYGLKLPTGFHDTHLGRIGRRPAAAEAEAQLPTPPDTRPTMPARFHRFAILLPALAALAAGCHRPPVVTPAAAAAVPADPPALRPADRVRLAEALRLAEQLREEVWPGWSAAPFAQLLVTADHEFLLRHPGPTPEFRLLGPDPLLRSEVHVRERQFPPNMAAAFPAVGGVSTIVIGQPENTGHASARWVLTVLHEHFHQLQYAQPGYHARVEALDLTGGDRTGMWMLNYPFPYDSVEVQRRFAEMAGALADALEAGTDAELAARLSTFDTARRAFRASVPERDQRYFAFQAWQEGIARYTEYRLARLAAERYRPTPDFLALGEGTSFAAAAEELRRGIVEGLRRADLGRQQRVAFYPFGAAMGLLLDRAAPGWRERYQAEPFDLDVYLAPR